MKLNLKQYALDGTSVVEVPDFMEWATWFESADRIVKQEYVGPYMVSTVFIGIDIHHPPQLFETRIFCDGGSLPAGFTQRCSTWIDAIAMHQRGVEWAKAQPGGAA